MLTDLGESVATSPSSRLAVSLRRRADRLVPLLRCSMVVPIAVGQLLAVVVVLAMARTDDAITQSLRMIVVFVALPCGAVLTDRAAITVASSPTSLRSRALERATLTVAGTAIAWSLTLVIVANRTAMTTPALLLTGQCMALVLLTIAAGACAVRGDPSTRAGGAGAGTTFAFVVTLMACSQLWEWAPVIGGERQPGFWCAAAIGSIAAFVWATRDPAARPRRQGVQR